jgi:maltose O-acetyltransferase
MLLQTGCIVHCDEAVTIGRQAGIGEYSTIIDSSHSHEGADEWFMHNVRTAPVVIGRDAWLGAKVTVSRGVRIGDRCVVGANSVVVKDVPDGCFASGVPARVLRHLGDPVPDDAGEPATDRQRP